MRSATYKDTRKLVYLYKHKKRIYFKYTFSTKKPMGHPQEAQPITAKEGERKKPWGPPTTPPPLYAPAQPGKSHSLGRLFYFRSRDQLPLPPPWPSPKRPALLCGWVSHHWYFSL